MIVRRERERLSFKSASYHDLRATLALPGGGQTFKAVLIEVAGSPVASGKDFGPDGVLSDSGKRKVLLVDEARAAEIAKALSGKGAEWNVATVETKRQRRKPPVPFITSTLQQVMSIQDPPNTGQISVGAR